MNASGDLVEISIRVIAGVATGGASAAGATLAVEVVVMVTDACRKATRNIAWQAVRPHRRRSRRAAETTWAYRRLAASDMAAADQCRAQPTRPCQWLLACRPHSHRSWPGIWTDDRSVQSNSTTTCCCWSRSLMKKEHER